MEGKKSTGKIKNITGKKDSDELTETTGGCGEKKTLLKKTESSELSSPVNPRFWVDISGYWGCFKLTYYPGGGGGFERLKKSDGPRGGMEGAKNPWLSQERKTGIRLHNGERANPAVGLKKRLKKN